MAYVSATDVEAYIGDVTDDTRITTMISQAEKIIERFTNRVFEISGDDIKYIDAVGDHIDGSMLYVDHIDDLFAIASVTNGDSVVVASSEYITFPRNATPFYAIKLLSSANKSWTYSTDYEGAIQINGKWGYSETPPDDIKLACILTVKWLWDAKDSPANIQRTMISPSGVTMLPAGFPADVKALLKPYVRLV